MNKLTTRERPTLGALLVAFLTAVASWGWDAIPASVPTEVTASGYPLVLFAIGVGVGQAVQRLGKRAPWAVDTHAAAVAYAKSLPADAADEHVAAFLEQAGVGTVDEAARLIGADPDDR